MQYKWDENELSIFLNILINNIYINNEVKLILELKKYIKTDAFITFG